jgi:hypothetical protein
MSEQQRQRLPIKSPTTGFTLALMSSKGLELYCKHTRQWEVHSIDEILRIYQEAQKLAEKSQKNEQSA